MTTSPHLVRGQRVALGVEVGTRLNGCDDDNDDDGGDDSDIPQSSIACLPYNMHIT